MSRRCRLAVLGTRLALVVGLALPLSGLAAPCPSPGQWLAADGTPVASDELMRDLAHQSVVLLGEEHDQLAHHRWQLHTLAGLHALRPDMVIGLEMLPREAQSTLDAWVAGELSEAAFLEASDWESAWGLDPALYLPILHFARMHGVPLKALNIVPALRRRLASDGWASVPARERFDIPAPAAPSPAYRRSLAEVFDRHAGSDDPDALERFIAAQLVWDRAMASALAEATEDDALVVGLMGLRHLTFGHGVPHQLADLGVTAQQSLLPRPRQADCQQPPEGLADAYFTLGDEAPFTAPAPPRLGVMIGPHPAGVEIRSVGPDSVAAAAGLREGDVILAAAGRPLETPGELSARVREQPPGTLLPLEVRRDDDIREVLARFPVATP
ncbi:ChaN family lipoprotein [Halomonas nitroreducens]|uniref:PDZ domain-containing protein n=1 Tax=Halomonas nitroreducens TaxID=447425 RepID=A0A3S0JBX0_9GAMM|nr:ChaN family lipoprotein [Halomonas nitroreducens]RTR05932.1 PDZ domain-containing protein [Halomonas nitroreducens]